MAEVALSKGDHSVLHTVITWAGATNGGTPDTFQPVKLSRLPYAISAQVTGNFSGSASIALHGSIDGTNYAALNDRQGSAIAVTAAGIANCGDAPLYLKPVLSSGDGSTDLDVSLLVWFED